MRSLVLCTVEHIADFTLLSLALRYTVSDMVSLLDFLVTPLAMIGLWAQVYG